MTQSAPAKLRSLTAQEQIFWLLNWNSPIHPVVIAHVAGSTAPEQWRAALDQLQQRHPALSMSIQGPDPAEPGDGRSFFEQRSSPSIPLRVVPRASVLRWEAEVERELATPFVPGQAPLLRAVLIYAPDRSIVILAGCHCIADGISFALLFRDLLTAMAGQSLEPLPIARSAEELLGLGPVALAQPVGEDLSTAPVNKDGTPTVRSLQLTTSLTLALVSAARKQGVTVHGLLAAAVVVAMRRQAPEFLHKALRFISPINTREILGVQDECGMYFTSPQLCFDPTETFSIVESARSVRQSIAEARTREALVAVTTATQGMIASGLTRAGAADMLQSVLAEDVLLSNLGRTPFGSIFGHLHLESLWPAVLPGLPEVQTVGAATTNDALCLVLTSYRPVPQLLEAIETVLKTIGIE